MGLAARYEVSGSSGKRSNPPMFARPVIGVIGSLILHLSPPAGNLSEVSPCGLNLMRCQPESAAGKVSPFLGLMKSGPLP
jgi:hypothetical protein